jgi:hypothetical protein
MVSKLDTDEPSERSGGAGGLIRHPQQQHRAPGPLYRKQNNHRVLLPPFSRTVYHHKKGGNRFLSPEEQYQAR